MLQHVVVVLQSVLVQFDFVHLLQQALVPPLRFLVQTPHLVGLKNMASTQHHTDMLQNNTEQDEGEIHSPNLNSYISQANVCIAQLKQTTQKQCKDINISNTSRPLLCLHIWSVKPHFLTSAPCRAWRERYCAIRRSAWVSARDLASSRSWRWSSFVWAHKMKQMVRITRRHKDAVAGHKTKQAVRTTSRCYCWT